MGRARRPLWVLIALMASLVVDAAASAPVRLMKDLGARSCCQRNCSHALGTVCATGCCPDAKTFSQPSSATLAKDAPTAPVIAVVPAERISVEALGSTENRRPLLHPGNEPPTPILLLTSTLRL